MQGEQRAFARTIAIGGKPAIHFNRRQGAAVQTEAMTFLASGEAVGEDPRHVFGGDAFTFVFDADLQDVVLYRLDRQRNLPRPVGQVGHGVLGVADQVDHDQQQPVFVGHDLRYVGVFLDHCHMMAIQRAGIHAQRVVHQALTCKGSSTLETPA